MSASTPTAARRRPNTQLVRRLAEANRLRREWTADRAVAALMVITSLESFETLVSRHGWTVAEAGTTLAEMAAVIREP